MVSTPAQMCWVSRWRSMTLSAVLFRAAGRAALGSTKHVCCGSRPRKIISAILGENGVIFVWRALARVNYATIRVVRRESRRFLHAAPPLLAQKGQGSQNVARAPPLYHSPQELNCAT
mmetsp:Transcript_13341/g.49576  ORF Transcript_13341/g.49576 Transcript_13341/m.49576 type:complete len:118 (-) Transcript_13341:22-375(-)